VSVGCAPSGSTLVEGVWGNDKRLPLRLHPSMIADFLRDDEDLVSEKTS